MNYLEHINYRLVSPPAALDASATVTSSWVDTNGLLSFHFLTAIGAVAEGKKIKLELLGADNASGTDAKQIGMAEFTAPETITGRVLPIRGRPLPDYRYYAVKVTNVDASATNCAISLVSAPGYLTGDDNAPLIRV